MRHEQVTEASRPAGEAALRHLLPGRPQRLTGDGWLSVVSGSVWLTRLDDAEDYWLTAGQTLHVQHARGVIVEAWDHAPAQVGWHVAVPVLAGATLSRRIAQAALPAARSFAALAQATVARLAAAAGDNPLLGHDGRRADGRQRSGGSSAWA